MKYLLGQSIQTMLNVTLNTTSLQVANSPHLMDAQNGKYVDRNRLLNSNVARQSSNWSFASRKGGADVHISNPQIERAGSFDSITSGMSLQSSGISVVDPVTLYEATQLARIFRGGQSVNSGHSGSGCAAVLLWWLRYLFSEVFFNKPIDLFIWMLWS